MAAETFPYTYREYQKEFIEWVRENVKDKNLAINAVTGFGKTPLILSSLLPQAINEKRKVVWTVKTGNEIDRPIEELKTISDITDTKVFGISFRGKRDMCLLLNDFKFRERVNYDDVKYICDVNREKCKYFRNLKKEKVASHDMPMFYSEILSKCEEDEICPYYLQLKMLSFSSVISLSYNYMLDEDVRRVIQNSLDLKNAFLVVDEAHNLQLASISLNSDHISEISILKAIKEVRDYGIKSKKIIRFLRFVLDNLRREFQNVNEDKEFDLKTFIAKVGEEEFLKTKELLYREGLIVRARRFQNNQVPRSSLFHISEFFSRSYDNLEIEGVVFILSRDFKEKIKLELVDMRTSKVLSEVWDLTYRNIFCSGTLNPIDDFARVIGLNNYVGKSFPSIFNSRNAFSMITPYLTTEGIEFRKEMAKAYLETLRVFISSLNENIAIFSSSYRIQDALISEGLCDIINENRRKFFVEEQSMSGQKGREVLQQFKACSETETKGVLCATMMGRFAEGADFPKRQLEGIFLAGVPFERVTTRTRLYIDYFQKIYGENIGKYYAYILPALKRSSQALGRALRSKEDKAIFVLGDRRYKKFLGLLPDFVNQNYTTVYDDMALATEIRWHYYSS